MEIYNETWFVVLMLFLCFPIGVFLMWRHKNEWSTKLKTFITAIGCFIIIFLAIFLGDSFKNKPLNENNNDIDVFFENYNDVTNVNVQENVTEPNTENFEDDQVATIESSQESLIQTSKITTTVEEIITNTSTIPSNNSILTTTKKNKSNKTNTKTTTTTTKSNQENHITTTKQQSISTTTTLQDEETTLVVTETVSTPISETVTSSDGMSFDLNTIVYVSGKYYHYDKKCAKTYMPMTLGDAMDEGKAPCPKCVLIHYQ